MRTRILLGTTLLLLVATGAERGGAAAPAFQSAVVYLTEPTLIGSTIVEGPVLFTHDNRKMARGEACTSVYLFEPRSGPVEEVASFHCVPTPRKVVREFTIRTEPNDELGFGCILTEYQFGGDSEGHGVPTQSHAQ